MDKHGKHCHEKWGFFLRFVLSVYGILWREAPVVLANLSRLVEEKTDEPISHVHRWINVWIVIAVARSYL